jgi:hypothetical protein
MAEKGDRINNPSPRQLFGTRCHKVAEVWLTTGQPPKDVTEEEISAVEDYVDFCSQFPDPRIESRVAFSPDIWGTVDFWAFDGETLRVADLKTGLGYVEEFENWQLVIYALAICKTCKIRPVRYELTVVQSTCFGGETIRSWDVPPGQMAAYEYELSEYQEGAKVTPGPHCQYCPARHRCEAIYRSAGGLLEAAMDPISAELDPAEIGKRLEEIASARERLNAVEDGLLTLADTQNITPLGWEWKPKLGHAAWKIPAEFLESLAAAHNVDLFERKPISPSKAKELLPKGAIDNLTFRPENGRKLTKISAKKARKVFSK